MKKKCVLMMLGFCLLGAFATEAQQAQGRAECLATCNKRWLDDCPKAMAKIIKFWTADPKATAAAGVNVQRLKIQLQAFCNSGYANCITRCPPE